jgi:hypothetical protein
MIQPVPKLHKEEKIISRQVKLVVTSLLVTTEYLHWTEQPIDNTTNVLTSELFCMTLDKSVIK